MAYRRRQGITRASTFKEEIHHPPDNDDNNVNNKTKLTSFHTFTSSSSLAAQAIKASAAHRESSLSSAYAGDSISQRSPKVFDAYEDNSERSDSKGFWGVLARKAKAILEDDNISQQFDSPPTRSSRFQMSDTSPGAQSHQSYLTPESFRKMDNPTLRKGLDKITSSLNQIGDTFEKAFEEGRTIVENKTADIKLQIRRKGSGAEAQNQAPSAYSTWQQPLVQPAQPQNPMNPENQLKASRDVAMATAAKAKLLLRELKTVKADLAFAKQRCSQLEEENKILRESREKGGNHADDDLIRLQLETLLAEKARLAHENSIYARENRFLREIVEYHQLTMQDVVYLNEGSEEVTEVYPFTKMLSVSPPSPIYPPSPSDIITSAALPETNENFLAPNPPRETQEDSESVIPQSETLLLEEEDGKVNNISREEDAESTELIKKDSKKLSPISSA